MKIQTLNCIALFAWSLVSGVTPAGASLIVGVSASTDMGASFGTDLANTVNGMGLTGDVPSLMSDHADTLPANSWIGTATTGLITFDLGGTYLVDGFSFWNQNNGGPGVAGTSGIHQVVVTFSTNGIAFQPLIGAPTSFAQVSGSGPVGPESFAFAAQSASHIRFQVLSNHGDTFVGFAEVQFSQYVPEVRGGGLWIGLVWLARRRLRQPTSR